MLNYAIINDKPNVTIVKDGEATLMKDLTVKSVDLSRMPMSQLVKINKHYIARPDLVSLAIYGTDIYGDILCKINGISNPFELNENMILICPEKQSLSTLLISGMSSNELVSPKSKTNSNGNDDNVFKDFTTSMLSNNKIKYDLLKERGFKSKNEKSTIGISKEEQKKKKNERRSPAEQTIEDKNYVINKTLGIVIY